MSTPTMLTTNIHSDGTQSAQASSTPKTDKSGCEFLVMPRKVIPIVFLPGIMGTHLRFSSGGQKGKVAWRPDALKDTVWETYSLSPAERQLRWDPWNTEVDRYDPGSKEDDKRNKNVSDIAFLSGDCSVTKQERDRHARMRGWSEIMFSSYGTILQTMEKRLNEMCCLGNPHPNWDDVVGVSPKNWGGNGGEPLAADELRNISDAWYPVYAIGYHWLRSNGDAAKEVAKRIREIIQYYKDRKFKCEKVIVVTHSMGGLVGRALIHPDYGNALDVVAGIVHGAMPAVGAAAAYARVRSGTENSGTGFGWVVGSVSSKIMGNSGPNMTATFANSPGALQLLPSERYGPGWLKIERDGKEVLSLPKADPYAEIYTVQDKWYRLIVPEWVNPARSEFATLQKVFNNIRVARDFHRDISVCYHPETYVSHGSDMKMKSWGNVVWASKGAGKATNAPLPLPTQNSPALTDGAYISKDPTEWHVKSDGPSGEILLADRSGQHTFFTRIKEASDAGDGTVPAVRSAQDPIRQGQTRIFYTQTGYDHQGSYKNKLVIASTLHAVCKIAHFSFNWWD